MPAARGSVGIRVGNAESVRRFAMRRDRSRVRPAMVHRLAQHRLQDHHLLVRRHVAVGERVGPTMTYAIVSILFATLETYVWLFRPNSHASPNPITIGLPLVVAAGIFKRPANERAAILTFAAIGAVSLNRALIAQQSLVHVVVFGGAGYLAWWAYRSAEVSRAAFKRLAVVMGVTLGGFVLAWLWQLM